MTDADRDEYERMKKFISSVAGCTNCSACREVALKFVGSQWKKAGD